MSENIAVVGGGMFGVTSAVELSQSGHDVTLYEKQDNILQAASGSNHWRLHRGYHYPQSDKTAEETLRTEPLFRSRYEEAVIQDEKHYYAIANESKVSFDDYVEFMQRHGLEYRVAESNLVNNEKIEELLLVDENHVSPVRLRELCWEELESAGVSVKLENTVDKAEHLIGDQHDHVVIAAYANTNSLLPAGHDLRRRFKFEVCEVPIIQMPEYYTGSNIIVVYGPFMSTDHWGSTGYFAMGDFHHMRHHTSVGYEPDVPQKYLPFVNGGLIDSPSITNFDSFKTHGQQYIPGVKNAEYQGSLFTIRTILPDVEETDARPTMINHSGDIITVFGGKLSTSVQTSKDVRKKVNEVWE